MQKHIIYLRIAVAVRSKLNAGEAAQQFGSETDYNFQSTEDVEVLDTHILDTETNATDHENDKRP